MIKNLKHRDYYEKHRGEILKQRKEYKKKNKDKIKNSCKHYYKRNKKKILEYNKKQYRKNKDAHRIRNAKIKAKLLYDLSLEEYLELTSKCSICDWKDNIHLHHMDRNKKNNMKWNFFPVCPNHHAQVHSSYLRKM